MPGFLVPALYKTDKNRELQKLSIYKQWNILYSIKWREPISCISYKRRRI